jgi:hypothetical protein
MKKLSQLLVLLFVIVYITNAQTTFDVFTYKEPKGYTKQTGTGFVSYLKYNKNKTGFCNIGIYGAIQNSGTLQEVFTTDWNDLVVKSYKPTAQPQTELAQDINGWKVISGYAPYTADGTQRAAMLYTFANNNMAADIVIATNSNEFEADITALINSLKFSNPKNNNNETSTLKAKNDAIKKAKTTNSNSKFGGGITGVWLCYTNNYPFSTDMIWKRRVFFNDGTFLHGHPYFGLFNFKEDENNELGTYKINGNNGSINMKKWINPTAFTLIKPNQIKIGNDVYYKSDDVNGKTFSGSYTSYDFSLFNEVAQQPVNNRSLIHFYSNGIFVDEGIFKIFLTSYDGTDDSPGKGTYSIKDYTIIFKYDDGRTRTSAISTAFSSKLQDCKFLSLNNGVINKYK